MLRLSQPGWRPVKTNTLNSKRNTARASLRAWWPLPTPLGGRVLIGVNDRGRVASLPDADKVVESVLSACREAVSPPLTPVVAIVRLPEGVLVVAQVAATGRMHAKSGAVLVRHGRQTRRASAEEIRLLTLRETPEAHEATSCPSAIWANLDEAALRKYFSARARPVCWSNLASPSKHWPWVKSSLPARGARPRSCRP